MQKYCFTKLRGTSDELPGRKPCVEHCTSPREQNLIYRDMWGFITKEKRGKTRFTRQHKNGQMLHIL